MMWTRENVVKWAQLGDETYNQAWLNEPPIQFPLHPKSPIQNIYSNTSSSYVRDKDNNIEVGMDDFLCDTHAMEEIFLDALL